MLSELHKEAYRLAVSKITYKDISTFNIPIYSDFQAYVITQLPKLEDLLDCPDKVFYFSEWTTPEELFKIWFNYVNKTTQWWHELSGAMQDIVRDKYTKQTKLRQTLVWSYTFGEWYERYKNQSN